MTSTRNRPAEPHAPGGHTAAHPGRSAPTSADDERRRPWTVLALAVAAQVLVVLDISVVNTALPTIGRSLDLDGSALQWLITAYLLTSGGGLLLGGRIADVFARKHVFLTGVTIFTIASMTSGLATNIGVLVAARAGQGVGAALMTPAALSLIMTSYSGTQRAKALALWGAIGSMGIAAGVLLGGALTTWFGWRMIFWINVPVGFGVLFAGLVVLPARSVDRAAARRLDLPGAAAVVAGLGALVFGIESITSHGTTSPITAAAFVAAAVLLAAFVRIERRASTPLVPPHAWRMRPLVSGTATIAGITAVLVGVIFLTSIFCQTVLGYSALRTGIALVPIAVALAAGTHVARHLMARTSARHVAAGGLVVAAVGAFLLQHGTGSSSYVTGVLPGLIVLGAGSGVVFVAVFISASAGIPPEHAGTASGLVMTGHEIGAALGVAILAAVATGAGDLATADGAATGAGRGFAVAGALALGVAALAATAMSKSRDLGAVEGHMHMH
jgi:EmrB/QacA subfamily drug resistance transporter